MFISLFPIHFELLMSFQNIYNMIEFENNDNSN